jgi:hypothetical protein
LIIERDSGDHDHPFLQIRKRKLVGHKSHPAKEFKYSNSKGKCGDHFRQWYSPYSQKNSPVSNETKESCNTNGHNDRQYKWKLEVVKEHPNNKSTEDIKTPISKISHSANAKSETETDRG